MADAGLSVTLGLRLDQFEQQMSRAGQIAGDAVSSIEQTFAGANITLGSAIGTALGGGIGKAIEQVIEQMKEFVGRIDDLNEAAHRANISVNELFRLQQALGAGGLNTKEVNAGLEKMAALISQSTREETSLSKLFKENGDSLKTATGEARPLPDILKQVADYIENAKNGADEIKIAELAGLSDKWAKALRAGGDALQNSVFAAQDVSVEMKRLIDAADQFKANWKLATEAMGTALLAVANDFFTRVGLGWDLLIRRIEGQSFESIMARRNIVPDLGGRAVDPDRAQGRTSPIADVTVGGGTKIPLSKTPKAATESEDEIERLVRQSQKLVDVKTAQIEALGLSNIKTQEAIGLAKLETAEREAGRKATEEETAAILAGARSRGQLADAQAKMNKEIELQKFVGNQMVDVFQKLAEGGAKFQDIMQDVVKAISRAVLQAAILGEGPLAGLFGTTSGTKQAGGLIGLISAGIKSIPKFQDGGVVPGSGPQLAMVHGGETIIPRGGALGGGVSIVQQIDARGAQLGVAEQIAAALSANNRALQVTLPSMIRSAQSRGAIR